MVFLHSYWLSFFWTKRAVQARFVFCIIGLNQCHLTLASITLL